VLEVYVTPHCEACEHARELAAQAASEFIDVDVSIVNMAEIEVPQPAGAFAVPSFVLDGVIVSLGNPSWKRLRALLAEGSVV